MMRKISFLIVFLFSLFQAYAQDRNITGKVVDETGAGMPGATVQVKGSTRGTVTDVDGAYTISASTGSVLQISYVGYLMQEITVGESNVYDVTLAPDVQNLEQVVVVGYGVQKKSLVTGSIAKVDAKSLSAGVATRFEQALQGKVSGVVVAQNSGAPGSGLTIKIRGNSSDRNNSPLYIVDGVKTGGLEYLNPSDIESVEILKDAASAAIYGAEGGNGVVLVTTKKGTKGTSNIEYRYAHGEQTATNLPKVMNAQQYKEYFSEATKTEMGYKAKPTKQEIEANELFSGLDATNGTNWVDKVFQTAPMDEHTINFSGGGEKTTYFISSSYLTQDGIVGGDKNNFTRYSFRSNVESEVKSWFTIGTNTSYSRFIRNDLNTTSEYGGIINNSMNYDPTIPVYFNEIPANFANDSAVVAAWNRDASGRLYSKSTVTAGEAWNPLAQIDAAKDTKTQDKIVADIHGDLKPFSGMKITSRIFADYAYQKNDKYTLKNFYGVDPITADTNTFVEQSWDRWYKYGIENFASFNRQFGDHSLELMAGQSFESYSHYFLYLKLFNIRYNSPEYAYPEQALDTKRFDVNDQSSNPENVNQASYFGRFVYNYKEFLMLQSNFRRDGVSKLGADKFQNFPSFSAGLNINKMEFFQSLPLSFISNLKLRASWGRNGSHQSLETFPYVTQMTTVYYSDASPNGSRSLGAVPGRAANINIMWETSEQLNVGADFGFFNNALTLSIDRYKKSTIDQIAVRADFPYYLGYQDGPFVNDGEIVNKGWEFDLNYKGNAGDLNFGVGFNASYLNNEVVAYGTEQGKWGANIGQFGQVNRYDIGKPVWYFYGYKAIGIFQTEQEVADYKNAKEKPIQPKAHAGDVKFMDMPVDSLGGVGDGKIDEKDMEYLGKPMPDWTFGFNLNLDYKGFDLSMYFQGVTGNQILWANYRKDRVSYNRNTIWYDERWTGEGTSTKYPRATYNDANDNYRVSSLYVHDGDYLRLKSLTLGYTLPKSFTSIALIQKLRIYYSGTNLLTWTGYPGTDPEVGMYDTNNNYSYGIDKGLYPPTRIHTFGLNVVF